MVQSYSLTNEGCPLDIEQIKKKVKNIYQRETKLTILI